jgi:hypothetical protein
MPRLRYVAAALLLIPAIGIAQGTPPGRTHTVKRGDTLWDLAQQYLGDPFLWPEIYRVNTDVVEDPHWIYPGEVLRIPDVAALAQRTQDEVAVQTPTRPGGAMPTPPAPRPMVIPPRLESNLRFAVRAGEYLAAPFVGPDGGPSGAGRITGAATTGNLPENTEGKSLLHMDRVVIQPPAGVRAVRGDRFMVYRLGDKLVGRGQIVEPVGTVLVEDAGSAQAGGAVLGVVDLMFHSVRVGDGLIPLDTLVQREGVFPAASEPYLTATILWVQYGPLLPSIGAYVIFNAAALDGVVTGDQITIVRPRGYDVNGDKLPDEALAVAQILKVTERGSSAVIIRTMNAGTAVGAIGRLTAKMPY